MKLLQGPAAAAVIYCGQCSCPLDQPCRCGWLIQDGQGGTAYVGALPEQGGRCARHPRPGGPLRIA